MPRRTLWIAAAILCCLGSAQSADPQPPGDPLAGEWSGSWHDGKAFWNVSADFHLIFEAKHGKLTGRFLPGASIRNQVVHVLGSDDLGQDHTDKNPSHAESIRKLVQTSSEPLRFQWEVDGFCWNLQIDGQRMSGFRNGGRCTAWGLGIGAKLVEVEATRAPSRK